MGNANGPAIPPDEAADLRLLLEETEREATPRRLTEAAWTLQVGLAARRGAGREDRRAPAEDEAARPGA